MRDADRSRILAGAAMLAVGAGAAALALSLIRPFSAGPAAADAAATVLYFERIVAREPLDAWVNTTPKPLLTLVYGLLHAGGDWRPISWATIAVWAAGVVLGAVVAYRERGPAAAAFAALGVVGTGSLMAQVSWANPLPWAYPLWLVALLAVNARPRRYGLAGVALLLAGLVRLETLIFVAVATLALLVLAVGGRAGRAGAAQRPAALLLLGWLAIPLMSVHDWLLAGDPGYWLEVARRYAASIEVRDAGWVTGLVISRLTASIPITVLALVGLVDLLVRRRWVPALALVTAVGGIIAMLYGFTFRGLQVLRYYSDPIELALVLAAAVGVGALANLPATLMRARSRRSKPYEGGPLRPAASGGRSLGLASAVGALAGVAVAAVLAVSLVWPRSILRPDFGDGMGRYTDLAANLEAMRPALVDALAGLPGARVAPANAGTDLVPRPATAMLLVPSQMETRMALELDLPLAHVAVLPTTRVDLQKGWPRAGQLVYIDLRDGRPTSGLFRPTGPRPIGPLRIVPLVAEQRPGVWLSRVEQPGGAGGPIDSAGATTP